MEIWQERLKQEADELENRLEKLVDFICGDKLTKLDAANQALLQVQFRIMQSYAQVLSERMELNNLTYDGK